MHFAFGGLGLTRLASARCIRSRRGGIPTLDGSPSRKRLLNRRVAVRKIKIGTRRVESPDAAGMETMSKPAFGGVQLALSIALFTACSVNLTLLSFWL